jgi:hypothetical protein
MEAIGYIEPPTIPAGMTIADYRRARRTPPKPLASRLIGLLSPSAAATARTPRRA